MRNLKIVLNKASDWFATDPTPAVIDWLAKELATCYDEAVSTGKVADFQHACKNHRFFRVVSQDPYSRRAFEKPKGYAGDAVMLDYIYRPKHEGLSLPIHAVHVATTTLPNAKSILWRQQYLAGLIRDVMDANRCPIVMSIACGHMRELDRLKELTSNTNVRFIALDQDVQSLEVAKESYPEFNIELANHSFTSLIKGRFREQKFDLIYSAGLLDYLDKAMGIALLKAMFAHLKPCGLLSIGNFSRDSHGRGFMAGFMDWILVYRDENEVEELLNEACPNSRYRIFRDDQNNVVYLEIYAALSTSHTY